MALNSSGRCDRCLAIVRNIDGRRKTIEQLTAVHNDTCPGIHRVTKTKKGGGE